MNLYLNEDVKALIVGNELYDRVYASNTFRGQF